MTTFDSAFTAVVRARGVWRDDTPAAVLERWESFVAECERGYRGDEFAYGNEAMSRTTLEAAFTDPSLQGYPELARLRQRVEAVDARLRPLLVEHAFPGIDADEWWLHGIVRRAGGRLAQDWKRSFGFDVEVVREPRLP
ncbi:hypothetical protein [uncultured Cellulomonas sp.]|uniref:hypothetical protein n=1 Tax=uncultured Cellulomonas sp. TaxID=189682 RepID=UPI0028E5B88E|nr:hypothetical protein [uncultured Cellulomonas sp.]